jgi:hypothetical protein
MFGGRKVSRRRKNLWPILARSGFHLWVSELNYYTSQLWAELWASKLHYCSLQHGRSKVSGLTTIRSQL